MKSFKRFTTGENDNINTNHADVRREYMRLRNKHKRNEFEERKFRILQKHPAVKNAK